MSELLQNGTVSFERDNIGMVKNKLVLLICAHACL